MKLRESERECSLLLFLLRFMITIEDVRQRYPEAKELTDEQIQWMLDLCYIVAHGEVEAFIASSDKDNKNIDHEKWQN